MTQIFAFGHSITQGFWDTEGGWVQRLRSFLDQKSLDNPDEYYFEVYNLGVSGNDSKQVLKRFEPEIETRISEDNDTVVFFQLGANDIQYFNEEYRLRTSKEEFENNILDLISKGRKYADEIIFVGDPIITIEGPIPWANEKELSDSRLKNYTDTLRKKCEKEGIGFIDLRSDMNKDQWSERLEDGCHPDNQGHKLIFEKVRDKMRGEEIIDF